MPVDAAPTRAISAAVFGNEKLVDVVLSLAEHRPATAQEVAQATGYGYSMARDVLQRLVRGNILTEVRSGSASRGPLFYDAVDDEVWRGLVTLAGTIRNAANVAVRDE